jgi:feruloyl esterase
MCEPNASNTTSCLTSTQVQTVNQVFAPFYGLNGTLYYPRMQPGSENYASSIMYNGEPFTYSQDWFRYVVYNNPSWSGKNFTLKDAAAALAQNPYNIQTWDGDISPFQKSGGKVLHYHGMQDQLISSEDSKWYYSHVSDTMKLPPSELDEFYRFFTVSGMSHCALGDGPAAIGQGSSTYAGSDPEDNVLMAMVRWVEEGVAPETIRGTKFTDGVGSEVEYRRKHCRYPRRNVHVGPGNYTDEDSWKCV